MYPNDLGRLKFPHQCCAICNSVFYTADNNDAWKRRYRVLYHDHTSNTAFSGLGIREALVSIPWYVPRGYDEAKTYRTRHDALAHELISVEGEKVEDVSGRIGYIAHETCWQALKAMYGPHQVPWIGLWNTLASLKGLAFPRCLGYDATDLGSAAAGALSDELEVLLHQEPSVPPAQVTVVSSPKASNDCFAMLPVELRILVVDQLTISDIFNLRKSSKAFVFVFYSQLFWAQRFTPERERAWVFGFSKEESPSHTDWRSLYKLTGRNCSLGLRQMKYLWSFLQYLRRIVPDNSISSFSEDVMCDFEWNWLHLPRFIRHTWQVSYTQRIYLPTPMVAMCVHFVKFGLLSIVAGITFTTSCGLTKRIGYSTDSVRVMAFNDDPIGFHFEPTEDGIADIQAAYPEKRADFFSDWQEDVEEASRTRLSLLVSGGITGVEGIFDGFRLLEVKLAGMDGASAT